MGGEFLFQVWRRIRPVLPYLSCSCVKGGVGELMPPVDICLGHTEGGHAKFLANQ